ncbi:hypothetical protein K435DRAFT_866008 [Dendrothele bispora CBS 962.96]|uniref:DUF4097 domain-containing protein n=1 Tax=Dendrothele bispora (strain CBS 962.96) TaxID=1314807 RepID=A0A4S8LHZ0_DENBC|nr:hypothetical protein K435DRAFT_866008 [Dendrothele bispora CBS 962.96]
MPIFFHNNFDFVGGHRYSSNGGSHNFFREGNSFCPGPNHRESEPLPPTRQDFELSITAETLRISCSGSSFYSGCLAIKQSDAVSDFARVEVVVTKYTHDIPEITATKIEEEELACIDISAPEETFMQWMTGRTARVDVTIHLPRGTQTDQDLPLKLRNFEADLNTFDVKIDDLMCSVEFESFDLSSSTGSFRVMGIHAVQGRIQAQSGNISGNFSATSKLSLKAMSGSVNAQSIILKNTEPSKAASLNINVMSGTAKAEKITLLSDLASGGNFSLKVSSNCGTAFCSVIFAPVNATIDMKTSCNSGTSKAILPSTYEGSFDVQTSIGRPSLDSGNPNELDPQGLDRRRQVQFRRNVDRFPIGGERSGWVFWSRDGKQRGNAEVRSDTGSASLGL